MPRRMYRYMQIIVVGLDHHTSPVEVRERLAFRPSQYPDAFDRLLHAPDSPLDEGAILSTCNRVEVYGITRDTAAAHAFLVTFLHQFHELPADSLSGVLRARIEREAVEHLFATASGANSLVLGEPQ